MSCGINVFAKTTRTILTSMAESFQDYSWIQDFEADFLCRPENAELGRL